jgi:peptidoglycan hydrolase-like protein with peptidoglycan-binding domain
MTRNRYRATAAAIAAMIVMSTALSAAAIDLESPSLFGPDEGWELADLGPGSSGPWTSRLQSALNRVGFHAGDPDGQFGTQTVAAVHAFQKVHDLERDGVFRSEHWPLLHLAPESPGPGGEPDRIEVDLESQVLYVVHESRIARVLAVSTGNGERYTNSSGSVVRARTPEGRFTFNRQRSGWHESYLGFMYAPFYFRGGYAIHGSGSVPAYPASHGCVRVTLDDMDYLREFLELGMPIYVYGNRISRSELLAAEARHRASGDYA